MPRQSRGDEDAKTCAAFSCLLGMVTAAWAVGFRNVHDAEFLSWDIARTHVYAFLNTSVVIPQKQRN